MTTMVAYFSWKGHTKKTATAIAKLLDAELVPIEPAGDIHVIRDAIKAFFRRKSPIRPAKSDLFEVDSLIIASPVWVGKVPPYVNAYLDAVINGSRKPFHVLIEMGCNGDQSAIAVVRKILEGKGMNFVSSATTIEKDVDDGSFMSTIEKFAEGIRK